MNMTIILHIVSHHKFSYYDWHLMTDPVSETSCLEKLMTMDNIQHNYHDYDTLSSEAFRLILKTKSYIHILMLLWVLDQFL
jgi:hypothetical protein